MKIQVQSRDNGLLDMAENRCPGGMEHVNNLPCEGDVYVTDAFIRNMGWRDNYRPCLVLMGEVREVRGEFPCGITAAEFGDGPDRPKVTYEYMLTNKELAKLCLAGMFDDDFHCPEIFFNNTFQLPMTCNCSALAPELDEDVPLLFVDINKPESLTTSSARSGYSIDEYFQAKPEAEDYVSAALEDDIMFAEQDIADEAEIEAADIMEEAVQDIVELSEVEHDEPEEEVVELTEEDVLLNESLARIEARKQEAIAKEKAKQLAAKQAADEIQEEEAESETEKTLSEDTVDKLVEVPAALETEVVSAPVQKPSEPVAVPQVRHYEDDDIDDIGDEEDEDGMEF